MEYPMLSIKRTIKLFADASLAPFGCEIRRKSTKVDAKAEGFPGYLDQANKIGMDVNEFQEQKLGWEDPCPFLSKRYFPTFARTRLSAISASAQVAGPGTSRLESAKESFISLTTLLGL